MFVSRVLIALAITIAVHSYHPSFHKHVVVRRGVTNTHPTLLHMTDGIESDDASVMYFDEEAYQSPLERFLSALEASIRDETMLKLTLSENDTSSNSEEEDENAAEPTASDYDWEFIKELAAISGRLIKKKTDTKIQLTYYKDKSMKKGDRTVLYSPSDAPTAISNYITKSFKKAMLSTKYSDFEMKMRKGQGKFRETSKVQLICFCFCCCI